MISCSKAERSRPLTRRARRIPRWADLATPCSSTGNRSCRLASPKARSFGCYLTNTANTRVFNVALRGARMKLVGGDSGRYERETLVESVVIAPSERMIVDVLFETAGQVSLEHRTPNRTYQLATITVDDKRAEPWLANEFADLRINADLAAERLRLASYITAEPDRTLALVAEMDMGEPQLSPGATLTYVCPMHPNVTSAEPGKCPQCGMKLLATERPASQFVCPMHPDVTSDSADRCPKCGMKLVPAHLVKQTSHEHHDHDTHAGAHGRHESVPANTPPLAGIEWEDDMVDVNRMTNPTNMRWKLVDRQTGAEGAIDRLAFPCRRPGQDPHRE